MGRGKRPHRLDGIFGRRRIDDGSIARPRCRQPSGFRGAYLWLHGRRRAAQGRSANFYRRDTGGQFGAVRSQRHDLSALERRASTRGAAYIRTGPPWIRHAKNGIAGRSMARSIRAVAALAWLDYGAALRRMIDFD